ncbi:MAG: EamA family transporter [Candidatus Falkowbacteria bacterium]
MSSAIGIGFALSALIFWAMGDFLIQKSTRLIGSWKSLFVNCAVAVLALTPFVIGRLSGLSAGNWLVLGALCVIITAAAILDYEALRKGKFAVIEPIFGVELPLTVVLSVLIGGEQLSLIQVFLILLIFFGLLATAIQSKKILRFISDFKWEAGVKYAIFAAIGMAAANFLTGIASRGSSPLVAVWAMNFFILTVSFVIIAAQGKLRAIPRDIINKPKVILGQAIFDNLAWVSFAFSTTYIAISITTAISESYIALAAAMGLLINQEKLQTHQFWGVAIVVTGIIALSIVS